MVRGTDGFRSIPRRVLKTLTTSVLTGVSCCAPTQQLLSAKGVIDLFFVYSVGRCDMLSDWVFAEFRGGTVRRHDTWWTIDCQNCRNRRLDCHRRKEWKRKMIVKHGYDAAAYRISGFIVNDGGKMKNALNRTDR